MPQANFSPIPGSSPTTFSSPTNSSNESNRFSLFITLICILAWFTLSTAISVLNKELYDPHHLNFTAPILATAIQSLAHFVVIFLVVHISFKRQFSGLTTRFSHFRFRSKEFLYLITTAFFYCTDIALSNASYRSLSISSYVMVKNSVPIFVLLFSFLFGLETITFQLICILLCILGGVAFAVRDQLAYQGPALFLVLLASACSGLRWTLTQILLTFQPSHDLSSSSSSSSSSSTSTHASSWVCIETLYKLAPWSTLFLFLTSFSVESFNGISFHSFGLWAILISGGLISFSMVLSEYYVVHFTSVLAFSIAGIAKESIILLSSMLIFGDRLTLMNLIGLLISLLGIVWFNFYRAFHPPSSSSSSPTSSLFFYYSKDSNLEDASSEFNFMPLNLEEFKRKKNHAKENATDEMVSLQTNQEET